ncbi:Integral membrane HPP family protein [Arabidopsis thaliana]|uniref:At5g62720 n=2 Tax=Arabidopsis thaliana TaxID=3702 RepID=Q8GZ51_ARATH|nr:Integral membrane HPP family protein [Arabidopsis thaliana]ABN04790.1 At5g62720 [Arabidopsis thaliana]AED97647.1 Integral membrane HPP family protein [Arabidopsis thaliana]BAC41883.1 unknown protein [Arabidopsis thaliana]|eukprot:NP_201078.1 Integral membrane HPP family protein [Arabidopsis thaliana]
MASVPVRPLPLLRRNITSTTASKSSPMLANVSSRHSLGISTYDEFLKQIKTPATVNHRRRVSTVVASAGNLTAPSWDSWKPDKTAAATALLLSDVIWPAAGAFAAMALLGRMDQMLSPKGISMSVAPLGAVSAILFITPSAPAARKYNIFLAQIGCAAIGVVAFSVFGPGWLARSVALAASIAFMVITRANHPPAASLPLMFIDGAKFHHLNFWYALFPGAAACVILCLLQSIVCYLKENMKF